MPRSARVWEVARVVGADPSDPDQSYLFSRAVKSGAAPALLTGPTRTIRPAVRPSRVQSNPAVRVPTAPSTATHAPTPGAPSTPVGNAIQPAYQGTVGTKPHVLIRAADLPVMVVEAYLHGLACLAAGNPNLPRRKFTAKEIRLGREALAHRDQVGEYARA